MLLFLSLLITLYLVVGHLFLRFLKFLHQDPNFLSMEHDPLVIKAVLWLLALIIWPSFVFDLGEQLIAGRKKR